MNKQPRRWTLSEQEWETVIEARRQPMTAKGALRLLARSPRLVPEVARDLLQSAKAGIWQSSALVWVLDSERVRQLVPDAARGIGFTNEAPFMAVLQPLLDDSQRVLDIGGGDGRISRQVAPQVRTIVCSDVAPTMVSEAAENLADRPNASAALTSGATLQPLPDASFDLAFAQGVLSYLEVNQGLALLSDTARVLAPGGTLVVNAYTIDRPEWAAEQLEGVRDAARRGRFTAGLKRSYVEAQLEGMVKAAGFTILSTGYGTDNPTERIPYIVVGRKLDA